MIKEYGFREVTRQVLALLDENESTVLERTEYSDEEATLPALIERLMPEAGEAVIRDADPDSVAVCPGMFVGAMEVHTDACGLRWVALPDDFARLVYFRMSDWQRGVTRPLRLDSAEYALRHSDGVRVGKRNRGPAVAVIREGGLRMLEVMGSAADAKVAAACYLAVPKIDLKRRTVELPESLFGAYCRKIADMAKADMEK